MMASLSVVARRLAFIRETDGPNRGAWVSWLQRFCGGKDGDPWCADFVSFVEDVATHGHPLSKRTGSCPDKLTSVKDRVVAQPQIDDIYFFIDATGFAHHVGIVTGTNPLTGIAGNTSEDGLSNNGTGVFEHALTVDPARIVFVRL